jgi:hypothetical protein
MRSQHRFALLALSAGLLAACGNHDTYNADAPLAFAPADTPYAYANLEPLPAAITEQWSKHMQEYMPELVGMYDHLLDQAGKDDKPESAHLIKVLRVLIDELKAHDTWDKLRQIGLKPDTRMALYGVGLVPVLRIELGDPAAFKAEIANIEQKLGEKLPVAKAGTQEYWQLGTAKLACAVAVQGTHLVVTVVPVGADDALKQTLLGLNRPAQNLAAAGTLQGLATQYKYSPYGEGFVDFVRLTDRLSKAPEGSDAEFAKALGLPLADPTDAVCKSEFLEIAHKFPRLAAGADEISAQRISISAQLEIETGLAQEIASALGSAPGTGAAADGVIDVSLSLPLLKLKDFWIHQADKVAAKPFACAELKDLNDSYRQSRQKIDVTIPPPASDITGVRATLDTIDLLTLPGGVPDMSGKLLFGSNNPLAALAMAQLALPQLKDLKLAADGKPVALPAGLIPGKTPPLFVAMSNKALALAAGAGEDAGLTAYLQAPPATEAVFLRMSFSGKLYGLIGQSAERMKTAMPAAQQAQWDQQKKLFALYEKWLRRGEFTFTANKNGIAMREVVEQNP